jgi:hypothetical protein
MGLDNSRTDISPCDQFLQVSIIPLPVGKIVPPHIHDLRKNSTVAATVTQESWVVLRGKIRIRLFDVDRMLLHEDELLPGFLLVTFNGGHALECLERETVMLEFKNGPYLGRDFETFQES